MIKSLLLIIVTAGVFSCKQANKSVTKNVDVKGVNLEKKLKRTKIYLRNMNIVIPKIRVL